MKERMRFGNDVHYLLREAAKGNAKSAYLAGLKFEEMGYDQFFVQAQFRRAAELGYPIAQRHLGILGLFHQLQVDNCSFSDVTYYQDYDVALSWLKKAASKGDNISSFILAKCKQLGVGMRADEAVGESEARKFVQFLSEDEVADVLLLFEYIKLKNDNAISNNAHHFHTAFLRGLAC